MASMRRRGGFIGLGLLLLSLPITAVLAGGEADDALAPMRAGMRVEACRPCHASEKDRVRLVDTSRACDTACTRCHKDMDRHHPVGMEVKEMERVPVPLLSAQKVGCISCHDIRSSPVDSKSWKSQSLFARLFQKEKTYKTYFLRVNNANGKLCKTCH
jgi:hypothetical protein